MDKCPLITQGMQSVIRHSELWQSVSETLQEEFLLLSCIVSEDVLGTILLYKVKVMAS